MNGCSRCFGDLGINEMGAEARLRVSLLVGLFLYKGRVPFVVDDLCANTTIVTSLVG